MASTSSKGAEESVALGHSESSDLTLIVQKVKFRVHRGILATYGGKPIRTLVELCDDGCMDLSDDNLESWRTVLDHLYSRTKDWTPAAAVKALPVIDKYDFYELIPGISDALSHINSIEYRTPNLADQLVRVSPETVRRWFLRHGSMVRRIETWVSTLQFSLQCLVESKNQQVAGWALDAITSYFRNLARLEDPGDDAERIDAAWDVIVRSYSDKNLFKYDEDNDVRLKLAELISLEVFRRNRTPLIADTMASRGHAFLLSKWFYDLDWYTEEVHEHYMSELTEVEALRVAGRCATKIKKKRPLQIA